MLKRMRRSCCVRPVLPPRSAFAGFRFPREVIVLAVRWYLRYGLSYRDVEELLAERGVQVDHVSVFRWVQRFTPLLAEAARPCRHRVGDRWWVDETYVKVSGRWSTGRSTSSGRSSTCMCPRGEMAVRPGVSSPGRWPPQRSSRWRSPRTRRQCTHMFLMSWPRVPGTARSSTPTTE